jgi:hypothetical protein
MLHPFRVRFASQLAVTQGVALGCDVAPRWGAKYAA